MKNRIISSFVLLAIVIALSIERNPAFQIHPTTYFGKPAFGRLNHSGSICQEYTFYIANIPAGVGSDPLKDSARWEIGHEIVTLPVELASISHWEWKE